MSEKLKPCPVQDFLIYNAELRVFCKCLDCPNRVPSQEEAEMRDALYDVLGVALISRVLDEEELVITSKATHIIAKYQKGGSK